MTVAGIAIEEAIPFNRVWSFPSQIVIAEPPLLTMPMITRECIRILEKNLKFTKFQLGSFGESALGGHAVGNLGPYPARHLSRNAFR